MTESGLSSWHSVPSILPLPRYVSGAFLLSEWAVICLYLPLRGIGILHFFSRYVKDNRSLWTLLSLWVCHLLDDVKYCNNIYYSTLTISRTVVAMWTTSCNWPRNCVFILGEGKRPFSQVSAFNYCSEQHQPWLIEQFFYCEIKSVFWGIT
jgi:hypothetical protein